MRITLNNSSRKEGNEEFLILLFLSVLGWQNGVGLCSCCAPVYFTRCRFDTRSRCVGFSDPAFTPTSKSLLPGLKCSLPNTKLTLLCPLPLTSEDFILNCEWSLWPVWCYYDLSPIDYIDWTGLRDVYEKYVNDGWKCLNYIRYCKICQVPCKQIYMTFQDKVVLKVCVNSFLLSRDD